MRKYGQLKRKDARAVGSFRRRVMEALGDDLVGLSLFGSKLTGDDTPESDIDILVLVKDEAMLAKDEVFDIAFDVNLEHGVYISPRVIRNSIFHDPVWSQTPFLRNLKENGRTL